MRKFIILGAALATLGASCKSIPGASFAKPRVQFKELVVRGVGFQGGDLDVVLSVYNPNGYELKGTRLTYRLLAQDSVEVAKGSLDQSFVMNKKDTANVRLPVTFAWSAFNGPIRQILERGTASYRVMGDITVDTPLGAQTLPFDQRGRFSPFKGTIR